MEEFEYSRRKRIEAGGKPSSIGFLRGLKLLGLFFVASFLALVFFMKGPWGKETRDTAVKIAGKLSPAPKIKLVEKKVEVIKEVEVQPKLPPKFVPWKNVDTAELFNGIKTKSQLQTNAGVETASSLRSNEESYVASFELGLSVPQPVLSLDDLAIVNPHLPNMVPNLENLMASSEISGFWFKMYENKARTIQQNVTRLNRALSRHNYYDCDTILKLTSSSGRQCLLIQSDMDVVSDGSDGDRMPVMAQEIVESDNYQAMTSYGWTKRSETPNPLLQPWIDRIEKAKKRYEVKGLSWQENRKLERVLDYGPKVVQDLKDRSFLIAEKDPFMVISKAMLGYQDRDSHAPLMGDYAVVIHEDKIYPCIVGDAGPSSKMGEASLFLARALNEKATPYKRPVEDLSVTYLVFTGSREKKAGPPNLSKWHRKCSEFLEEMGGIGAGYQLHRWQDPFSASQVN